MMITDRKRGREGRRELEFKKTEDKKKKKKGNQNQRGHVSPKPKENPGLRRCRARQITESSCGAVEWESRLKSAGDHGRVGTCRNWTVCWIPSQSRHAPARKEGPEAQGPNEPLRLRTPAPRRPGPRAQGRGTCRPTEASIWWPPFLFPVPMEKPLVIAKGPGPQQPGGQREARGIGSEQSTGSEHWVRSGG